MNIDFYPSLKEAEEIKESGLYRKVPIRAELFSDSFTTIEVLRTLKAAGREVFLLESAENDERFGRWSFLGYKPQLELTVRNSLVRLRRGSESETIVTDSPKQVISRIVRENRMPRLEGFPPFAGGLVGYFSYDYIKYGEKKLKGVLEENGGDFNDADLMLFDRILAFDSYRQKLVVISSCDLSDLPASYEEAKSKIKETISLLLGRSRAYFEPLRLKEPLKAEFTPERFEGMVKRAVKYIYEGDIFQVVLSNPMRAEAEGSLFDVYRVLRSSNPSPYMFYFTSDDIEIAGSSPETLLKLDDGRLFTYPLAGTRRRGRDEEEDEALEAELLQDEKERSEHNMLVDLGRNDIGRVARIGSVEVTSYMKIVRYSHVMHIASTVEGDLREDLDSLDALEAILPAGTLSGAPKIRAGEIIAELEGIKRGLYGGAIGYVDFSGNLDTAIAIRLVYKKNGKLCVHTGAGIVADSQAEREAQECLNKAMGTISAIKRAEGGIDVSVD